jgi:hypothetical protein
MCARWSGPALLVALAFVFFAPLTARPLRVLYSKNSDALGQHIPYKQFLVRSWRETGEIPLWCPHSLGGAPFVHDPQVSIFYPLNLTLLLVPPDHIGAAHSWLIVLQLVLGGLFAFAYARQEGLGRPGAFVTGAGYMLAGGWMLHALAAGQTVVIGLAWLPLVVLCFERSLSRRSLRWAAAAGMALAMLILGTHPQWVAYSGLFLVLWTLGKAAKGASDWRSASKAFLRWALFGAFAALLALALSAIQLLPTLEASEYSCRHVQGSADAHEDGTGWDAGLGPRLRLIGPSEGIHPDWESVAGIGLTWAIAALVGVWLGGRKSWWHAAVGGMVLAFGLTGGLGIHHLPILILFRCASRMLLLSSLPIALLAGLATDRLPQALSAIRSRNRLLAIMALIALVAVIYIGWRFLRMPAEERHFRWYWPTLVVSVPALFWAAGAPEGRLGAARVPLWCAALVADLLALSWPYVDVSRHEKVFPPSETVEFLTQRRADHGRVLDIYADGYLSPLGTGAPVALNRGLYPVRGYNPLDYFRYKNYLRMVSGTDRPSAPCEVVEDFPLTNRPLLDLLGVRYLLQPRDRPPKGEGWNIALEDPKPIVSYNYPHDGMHRLPPYTVYENESVLPRAFVVPRAQPLTQGRERSELLATDFRDTVLVEDCELAAFPSGPPDSFHDAVITEYLPNRVRIQVTGDVPGWLVLTDMWFPGWVCSVDGEVRPIYHGDYLFRTIPVSAGTHDVVFCFRPGSYLLGRSITLLALTGLGLWSLLAAAVKLRHAFLRPRQATTCPGSDLMKVAA